MCQLCVLFQLTIRIFQNLIYRIRILLNVIHTLIVFFKFLIIFYQIRQCKIHQKFI